MSAGDASAGARDPVCSERATPFAAAATPDRTTGALAARAVFGPSLRGDPLDSRQNRPMTDEACERVPPGNGRSAAEVRGTAQACYDARGAAIGFGEDGATASPTVGAVVGWIPVGRGATARLPTGDARTAKALPVSQGHASFAAGVEKKQNRIVLMDVPE